MVSFEVNRIKENHLPKPNRFLTKRFCLSMEVHPVDEKSDEKAAEKPNETYFDLYNPTG